MTKLKPGDKAPDFSLRDQNGKTVTLSDFRGRLVIVYFYPKADTPGCTTQACCLRDAVPDFRKSQVSVCGISPDAPAIQKKFSDKYDLNFPLLADEDHAVADAYGVWGEKSMYGRKYFGIIRSSFLIDGEGRILDCWYKISPKNTVSEAQSAIPSASS